MYHLGHREPLPRLLMSQFLQIQPFNIVQEHIGTSLLIIFERAIDTRQCKMVKPLEDLTFKCEACTLVLTWINYFLEGIHIAFDALIPYEINSTKAAHAKKTLYNIALLHNAP